MPTPNTGIPYLPEGTLDLSAGVNDALNVIDALLQTSVIDMTHTAPPVGPSDGDLYIVNSPATGAWAGHETDLARYVAEGAFWQFFTAGVQVHFVLNRDDFGLYKFDVGSSPGSWTIAAGLGDAPSDGEQYVRQDGSWEVAAPALSAMDEDSPPFSMTAIQTMIFDGATLTDELGGTLRIVYPAAAADSADLLTWSNEPTLPNSRRLLAGSGMAFNDATPGQRTISSTGGPPVANKVWVAGAGALEVQGATAAVLLGTATTPAKATGGTQIRGYITKRVQTSTTVANNVASLRSGTASDEAYAVVSGNGRAAGFYIRMNFGTAVVVAGERFFAGMAPNAAEAGTVDPSSLINCIGVGKDAGDANYQIMHNDGAGTCTKVNTGLAFLSGKSFELTLSVPLGGGSCDYVLTDKDTSVAYSGTLSTNLPASDVPLQWRVWGSVGAAAGVAVAIEVSEVRQRYPL